jgi:hypothetical protein
MEEDSKAVDLTKIWCPAIEGFRFVTACDSCKKKSKCQTYRDFIEPKFAWK